MKKMGFLLVAAFAALSLVAAGCGDEDDGGDGKGGSGGTIGGDGGTGGGGGTGGDGGTGGGTGVDPLTCDTFDRCGGNPVGTWQVVETCVEEASTFTLIEDSVCADLPITGTIGMSGSITYTTSKEIPSLVLTSTQRFTVTAACFALLGDQGYASCADIGNEVQCNCAEDNGGCDCDCSFEGSFSDTFDYEITGETLTYPGYEDVTPYCVQADTMGLDWGGLPVLLEKQ